MKLSQVLLLSGVGVIALGCDPSPVGSGSSPDGTPPLAGGGAGGSGGSTSSGGGTGGARDAGAPNPLTLTAPNETWTWVPVTGSKCANGGTAGVGVNLTQRSGDVFLYFEGGGACWDYFTCYAIKSAVNIEWGYSAQTFQGDSQLMDNSGVSNRADATNPFRNANFVFVPYCTGDLHDGTSAQAYNGFAPGQYTFHYGRKNVELYLERMKATFPNPPRVWLVGTSGGGFGAGLNFERVKAAFPNAEVSLLQDSSQMIAPDWGRWGAMVNSWGLKWPTDCTTCTGLDSYQAFIVKKYPTVRIGLLAFDQDQVLATFFGYGTLDVQAKTNALLNQVYVPSPNAKAFELVGTAHTMLGQFNTLAQPNGGITLKSWVTQWANASPAWATVRQ